MASVRSLRSGGLEFAYFEEGQGPLVLMVHGFPDTAHTWDHIRPVVARAGYRVVTPFTRGYAPSEIPADGAYDSDTLGRDIIGWISALGEEQAILIGHDWGASAAFSAVGLAPERFRKLITFAVPHPAGVRPTLSLMWKLRHFVSLRLPGAAARIRRGDCALIDELVRRWSPTWDVPEDATAAVKRAFAEPGCLEAALAYYKALTPRPPPGQRRKVQVPAAALAGESDIVPVEAFHQAASRYEAGYEVVVMPGGHFLHREHPKRFEQELMRLL